MSPFQQHIAGFAIDGSSYHALQASVEKEI